MRPAVLSRRGLLGGALAAPAVLRGASSSDIRIRSVRHSFVDHRYRAPYKFGGRLVDRITLLNVECEVETVGGAVARGFGSMPLGNAWAFPSRVLSYDQTLGAMRTLAERLSGITSGHREAGHPLDLNRTLEPAYLEAATAVARDLKLAEPIPKLCTLVTASPFDAALHDAFGKAHRRSSYQTYGPDLLPRDLGYYLGPAYRGLRLDRHLRKEPLPSVALFHSVGAADPIFAADVKTPVGDGLPETLPEWIEFSGLTHIKIKLNGDDLAWDVERMVQIERAAAETQQKRGVRKWVYILDFNERCPNVEHVLAFLRQVQERSPAALPRTLYMEQPTQRNLKADPPNRMHAVAKLKPVVADESLTDLESLLLARDLGYTGVALKACKGQSQAVLMAAAAQHHKMFLCVQDLTCPGASLIHSVGLAAHVPGVAGVEANARQYLPQANREWDPRFPGLFQPRNGQLNSSAIKGPGLGAVPA